MKFMIVILLIFSAFATNVEEMKSQLIKGKKEVIDLRKKLMNSLEINEKEIKNMGFGAINDKNMTVDMKCLSKPENKALHYARKAVEIAEDMAERKAEKLFKPYEEIKIQLFIESVRRKVYFTTTTLLMNKLNGKDFTKKEAKILIREVAKKVVKKAKRHDAVDEYLVLEKAEDEETKKKLIAIYTKEDLSDQLKFNKINALIYSYELQKAKRDIPIQRQALKQATIKEEVKLHGNKLVDSVERVEKSVKALNKIEKEIKVQEKQIKAAQKQQKKSEKKIEKIRQMKKKEEKVEKMMDNLDKPNCILNNQTHINNSTNSFTNTTHVNNSTQSSINITQINNSTNPPTNITQINNSTKLFTTNTTHVNNSTKLSTNITLPINTNLTKVNNRTIETKTNQTNTDIKKVNTTIPIPEPVNHNLTPEQKARAIHPTESYSKFNKKSSKKTINKEEVKKKDTNTKKRNNKKVSPKKESNSQPKNNKNKTLGITKFIKGVSKATHKLAKKAENRVSKVVKKIAGTSKQTTKKDDIKKKQLKQLKKSEKIVKKTEKKQLKKANKAIQKAEKKGRKMIKKAATIAGIKAGIQAQKQGLGFVKTARVVANAQIKAVNKAQKKVEKKIKKVTKKHAIKGKVVVDRVAQKEVIKVNAIAKKQK
ncbi:hypothetical protein, conserved [Entamoeba dispar SAW760]|uniref:Uncharacterized protein n=1 Tax=Entamoeba dispar (strain ATCC PRA-260 / SAW760) TaxID=370354 RepID=B0E8N3_ENTDS|nr:uncharacterized protein EDI_287630 [Entamoeba dispar SAW760]EDR29123.1 hypothetical protein, conserved [Entamoeba dispar SAW760]|eukprot:EDR29123.1 hypothetical protein, conserved [Entamoeba dispar SAW760]